MPKDFKNFFFLESQTFLGKTGQTHNNLKQKEIKSIKNIPMY